MDNKTSKLSEPSSVKKGKVIVLYTKAGGGHISVTKSIEKILIKHNYHVSSLNPYELVPKCDFFNRAFSIPAEEVYNKLILEKGWKGTFTIIFYLIVIINFRLCGKTSARRFAEHWKKERPDIIISTIPLSNFAIKKSIGLYKPEIPFIITLTDFHEGGKYSWFPKKDDYYIICPTKKSEQEALQKPHNSLRVFKTSGVMVDPAFYIEEFDTKVARENNNLDKNLPTACIMYGSHSDGFVEKIAILLMTVKPKFQVVFLCGKNKELVMSIKKLKLPYPHIIKSYTKNIPYYMGISDFFVGKPGALAISEAIVAKLPLLIDDRKTMIQEKYNLTWVIENDIGSTFKAHDDFIQEFEKLLDPVRRDYFSKNIRKVKNTAIFELPKIIEEISQQSQVHQSALRI